MKKAIGIDLGTTNSVVAFKDTAVKIIRNVENEELTRSCVAKRKGDLWLVGSKAFNDIKRDPINTVLSIKRLMGGAIKDDMVQDMVKSPYYKFAITELEGGTEDAVAVVLSGVQYTPEQISAKILEKIKNDASAALQDEVTHAVITVPAYFTEKQKNATRIAASLAGLKVQKLLAEPTAAAIAYGVDNLQPGDSKTVLIYDFGGGTFDLSILNIVDGQYLEAGTGGDRWLGGDDLDRKLQELVLKKVADSYNIPDINELIEKLPVNKKYAFEGQMRLQTEAAKIRLSSNATATVLIDNILEDENGDIIDLDIKITRREFEDMARPFVEKSMQLIDVLLRETQYEMGTIDSILLVGGTSCIPLVKQMLSDKYGAEKILVSEKPMLAIAEGAAILSHRMGDEYEEPADGAPVVVDISYSTNHNYFIELKDEKFDRIIEKQMPLPCEVSKLYKTTVANQKLVKVGIYADVENGGKEKQTMGFFTIEQDLPIQSEIIFDISLSIDEVFEIKVHPKNNKAKAKKIVLGRGNRDSKTLEFLSNCLDQVLTGDFSGHQRDNFLKAVKEEIEEINSLAPESDNSEKWEEISTRTYKAFEQVDKKEVEVDDDRITIIIASRILNEYADLITSEDETEIRMLLGEARNEDDPFLRIEAVQKLKALTDAYHILVSLLMIKTASEIAAKINPTDSHSLMQMHDEIINLIHHGRKSEVFELIDNAMAISGQYFQSGVKPGSVFLDNTQ